MMNQVILVGRLIENPKIEKNGEKNVCRITLAINRSFKNSEGIYDTDFIDCILWNVIAESTCEYCRIGDIIAVKGNIQRLEKDGVMEIIAEKVSFLQSSSNKKEE